MKPKTSFSGSLARISAAGLALSMAVSAQTSKKLTQLSHLRLSASGNAGIWGWVGGDGTEYALPTSRSGVAIVSLKDPRAPKELFHLASPEGTWHEVVTVGNYLYKCADQGTVGLQIWDLSPLPAAPAAQPSWTTVKACHSLWSDTLVTPKRLYVEGSGDIKILSLADGSRPTLLGTVRGEVHDGLARGGRLYVSTGGTRSMDIWDAANPAAAVRLGRAMIGQVSASLGEPQGYSHNVWITEDGKYAFTTEETNRCTVKMWDLSDEKKPTYTGGKYLAGTGMAHNAYVRGRLLYLSHYGQGVRVIDFKDPKNLVEIGFHNPGGSSWGCYPWLPSGLIIHGNGGLRVLEPDADIKITGGGSVSLAPLRRSDRLRLGGLDGNAVRFETLGAGPWSLSIEALDGRAVYRGSGSGKGMQTLALGRSRLGAGNYIVRVMQGAGPALAALRVGE